MLSNSLKDFPDITLKLRIKILSILANFSIAAKMKNESQQEQLKKKKNYVQP